MSMQLIAIGKRLPEWVNIAFSDYNRRLPGELQLELIEVAPATRHKSIPVKNAMKKEADSIRKHMPSGAFVIVLDEGGRQYNSTDLAKNLGKWLGTGRTVCFIIGGADGVEDRLRQSADVVWSLSSLTFPHAMARVIVAEQIYRAWSINTHHPYHRE